MEPARQELTTEIRWIRQGRLGDDVRAWFARLAPGLETREDDYLITPAMPGLSVKIRGGSSFDVKQHQGAVGALDILRMIGLETKAHLRPAGLTQIEMRKLELARAMAARPKLLISDEAMAGLSSAEVDDILTILFRLNEQGITIIMIEHIMRAVMRFSERIVVLDAGNRIAEGTPAEIVRNPAVEKAYLGE